MKVLDKNAAKAALRVVLIYFFAAGTGLALLRFFNPTMAEWDIGHLFSPQNTLFLCLTAALIFFLVYRLSAHLYRNIQLLSQNEIRYHSLFDNMHKGGAVYRPVDHGRDFVFIDINCSGEQIDQVNRRKLIGHRVTEIFPGIRESNLLNVMQRVHSTGKPEYLPISRYRDKYLESCRENYLFRLDSGEVVAVYDDVTEKKQLQEKLEQSKGELTLQNRIITQFLTTGDDTVYQRVLQIILKALRSSFGFFCYLNEQGKLICPTLSGEYRKLYNMQDLNIIFPPENWDSLWGQTLKDGKTMMKNSALTVPVGHIALQNGLAVPIRYQEEVIGIICIANKDEDYTDADTTLLESICSYLAPILNARLHAQYSENLRFETVVELVKSEASLKEAEKMAKIGHWEHHFATGALSWSDEVYRIFSQDAKQFKPSVQALLQQVHPDDREFVKQAFTAAITNKTTDDEITHRLLLADGTIKFVQERWIATYNNNGEPVNSLGTVQDITERVLAEESNRRLATAIDQAVDVIMITDENGTIQYVNPAFEKLTGYTRQEAVGQSSKLLKSGEHSPAFYQDLWLTISSGKVWHGRFVNKKKSGDFFTEETTITPVKDDTGRIINFVAVKHDISRELELEQQLRQAVKMEAIGTLAGGIAHDFNNILG
ncbi:MAG: PAS domain S-box protein, partial [Proteobacteria bacterium]|nr:PAS domain S-box protein [Pseudomonadota bacterium]